MTERKHLAYICAPFRGDVKKNIERAKEYARYVYELGYIPVTPHVMFPFLDDEKQVERESAIQMDLELLSKCEYMYIFGEMTLGMQKEFNFAQENSVACYMVSEKEFEKRNDNKYIDWLRGRSKDYMHYLNSSYDPEGVLEDAELLWEIADRLERLG